MEAIILAGGFGTRLQTVVSDVPKPMAPILSKPFLAWQMDFFISQNISHFILSTHYKSELIENYFKNSYKNISVTYAKEEVAMGTGGAILYAAQKLKTKNPFLVLNGDTFFKIDLKKMSEFHHQKNSKLTIALAHIAENIRYGSVETNAEEKILNFKEKDNSKQESWINSGAYLINPEILSLFEIKKLSFETELVPFLLKNSHSIYGYKSKEKFLDIGTPEDYQRASDFVLNS
jgi:D-glycero-alpha-D-manno-heptose 1-phosphate guanylyltransferase